MITVLINGYQGKMGRAAVAAINAADDLELIASTGRDDNLAQVLAEKKPNVAIDLTSADAAYTNTKTIIEAGVHPVIGSTGFTPAQIIELQQLSQTKNLGGIIAPNFSLGAVLMMKFAAMAAAHFPQCDIIEMHHPAKKDKPSGTAKKTAAMIEAAGGKAEVHSVRTDGVIANQEIIFGGQDETLTITHNTLSRECFMPGLLMCCRKVVTLNELLDGMEQLL